MALDGAEAASEDSRRQQGAARPPAHAGQKPGSHDLSPLSFVLKRNAFGEMATFKRSFVKAKNQMTP
jgi:hypothetical protein